MTETAWWPSTPDRWSVHRADKLFTIVSGSTPKTSVPEFWGGDIVWVTPNDQDQGTVDTLMSGERTITHEGLESCSTTLVPRGSVLLSSRAPIGYVSVAGHEMCTNQGFKTFVPKQGVDLEPRFLMWWLRSNRSRIERLGSGTTFKELSKRAASTIPVPLPPIEEQRAVVDTIERMLSVQEATAADVKRAAARAHRLRGALLHLAVSGRLGSGSEPVPERNGCTTLPWDVPSSWSVVKLVDLQPADRASAYGVLKPGDNVTDGVPFVRVGDIGEDGSIHANGLKRIAPEVASQYERTRLRGGEVLVSLVGTIGRTAIVPGSLRGANVARAVAVVPVSDVDPRWVRLVLASPLMQVWLEKAANEVARKTLNLGELRRAPIPAPETAVQQRILKRVDRLVSILATADSSIKAADGRSSALRRSILKAAFEGRFTDISDNPTSVEDLEEAIA